MFNRIVTKLGGNKGSEHSLSASHRLWHLGSPFQWASWDALVAFGSMMAAFRLTPASYGIAQVETHILSQSAAAVFAAATFIGSYALGMGLSTNLQSRSRIVLLILLLTASTMGGTSLVISSLLYKQIGRYIIVICALLFFATETCVRIYWYRKMKKSIHYIIVCCDDIFFNQLCTLLSKAPFKIIVDCVFRPESANLPKLETALAKSRLIHEIVVQVNSGIFNQQLLAALDRGVAVSSMDIFTERHFHKIPAALIDTKWFLQIDLKQYHPFYYNFKRLLDISLSLIGGILAAPLLLIAIVGIKLESRGPAFYSQVRVGLFQKEFTIWKLRTMRLNSEIDGPQWAKASDPRVTRVGRILRKMRIDEIPQLWNILCGEMALVGPRPERPEFVSKLTQTIPFYRQRHLIKPGLTGWAQICYRYGSSEDDAREKLSYDLYYLKNASLLLDFQICLQTISEVTRGSR